MAVTYQCRDDGHSFAGPYYYRESAYWEPEGHGVGILGWKKSDQKDRNLSTRNEGLSTLEIYIGELFNDSCRRGFTACDSGELVVADDIGRPTITIPLAA